MPIFWPLFRRLKLREQGSLPFVVGGFLAYLGCCGTLENHYKLVYWECSMNLSAPTKPVWSIALILGCLGLASHFVNIPQVTPNQFWLVAVGFVVLAASTCLKGI